MREESIIDMIQSNGLVEDLFKGNFGLEKENLWVDRHGNLADTKHPEIFGDKLQNPFITVDFAESQIEMITPALPSIKEMYEFLENLQDIISVEIGDEYLWPQSTPANLPCINSVSSANFDESNAGVEAKKYRNMLSEKYEKQDSFYLAYITIFHLKMNSLPSCIKLPKAVKATDSLKMICI